MAYRLTFFLSFLFISNLASSQSQFSFSECSSAVKAVRKFIDASIALADERRSNFEISNEVFEYTKNSFNEFFSAYTLSNCMEGKNPLVFQCLMSRSSDLTECR